MSPQKSPPADSSARPAEEEFRTLLSLNERYRGDLAALEEQRGALQNLLEEYRHAHEALAAMEEAQKGDEVLLPIGAGNFVRARLDDPSQIVSGLGSRVHVEGGVAAAAARLDERVASTKTASTRIEAESKRLMDELRQVTARLQELSAENPEAGM